MKKRTGALALAFALAVGSISMAADLTLSDGHVLPLDSTITVHDGSRSYLAPEFEKSLEQPELRKNLAERIRTLGLFPDRDTAHEEMMADQLIRLLKEGKVYQLRSERPEAMYQMVSVSARMGREDLARWVEIVNAIHRAHPEKINSVPSVPEPRDILEAQYKSTGAQNGRFVKGKTVCGTSYVAGGVYAAPQNEGMTFPLYAFVLETADDDHMGLTVFLTDQVTGKVFEPILKKGAEGLK